MTGTSASTARGTARIVGSLHRLDEHTGEVRMVDVYDTTIADLWSALTEPDRLARWVADVTGDLRPGGTVQAQFTSGWEGPGRIDVCEAPHRLVVTMSPGAADETVIEADLVADGDRTRLTVSERGLPLADLAAHGAGWQAHVEDLASHLAEREPDPWHDSWVAWKPAYDELASRLT